MARGRRGRPSQPPRGNFGRLSQTRRALLHSPGSGSDTTSETTNLISQGSTRASISTAFTTPLNSQALDSIPSTQQSPTRNAGTQGSLPSTEAGTQGTLRSTQQGTQDTLTSTQPGTQETLPLTEAGTQGSLPSTQDLAGTFPDIDEGGAAGKVIWSAAMEKSALELYVRAVQSGKRSDSGFKIEVHRSIATELCAEFPGVPFTGEKVRSKFNQVNFFLIVEDSILLTDVAMLVLIRRSRSGTTLFSHAKTQAGLGGTMHIIWSQRPKRCGVRS